MSYMKERSSSGSMSTLCHWRVRPYHSPVHDGLPRQATDRTQTAIMDTSNPAQPQSKDPVIQTVANLEPDWSAGRPQKRQPLPGKACTRPYV